MPTPSTIQPAIQEELTAIRTTAPSQCLVRLWEGASQERTLVPLRHTRGGKRLRTPQPHDGNDFFP